MNENQNPEAIIGDDVEGHGRYTGRVDGSDTDDVEGHAARGKALLPQEPTGDDVEGHGLRGPLEAEDTDDVEGHSVRGRG